MPYGTLTMAMLLNGLGFVGQTLHLFPDYFNHYATERLLGDGVFLPEHLNDDALGRCLDALYDYGVSKMYQSIAEQVVSHLGLDCHSINIDTTSFHTDGNYASDVDAHCIQITKGYSRDHRPELNQVILNLVTENQAGIPLYMQACHGHENDTKTFKHFVKSHLSSLKSAHNNRYLIGDSALYTEETIRLLDEQSQL